MKIGILASGKLGYKTVYSLFEQGILFSFLFTDKNSLDLISFASENGIPFYIGSPRRQEALVFLQKFKPTDLIISINYLFLLDEPFIKYPTYGCVNIHGSLLPKYRGRTPHVWAIINNEKIVGITVHYIDGGCDSGNILLQETVNIENQFTGGDILDEFEIRYPNLILKTIRLFEEGRPEGTTQNTDRATYFGKRTPEDGRIDWTWQKERIYNWVRAQADPYPGAFTFYNRTKIIVDSIIFAEYGFSWEMQNGLILIGGKRPYVKTSNGVIILAKLRSDVDFETGKIFE
jgi:methionyl-tRNA formyltransferase